MFTKDHHGTKSDPDQLNLPTHIHQARSQNCEKPLWASSCLSECPQGIRFPRDEFNDIFMFCYFLKICRENSSFIQIGQEKWVLDMKTNIHFWSYLAQFFRELKMFHTKVVEKIKTHLMFNIFRKSSRLWDSVEKCCRTGQATDDNMKHSHCMLDTEGYKYTLRLCNTYCLLWWFCIVL